MNDTPHLMAIIESKMAQVRTNLEHYSFARAKSLLTEIEIYSADLRYGLGKPASQGSEPWRPNSIGH